VRTEQVPTTPHTDPGLDTAISIADLERRAAQLMDPAGWDYLSGGAEDERTLTDNIAAFARRRFLPRVLVDTAALDPSTTLLGTRVASPIGVSPLAAHALAHPEGEIATARAAARAGALFCLSTVSSRSIEEVAAAVPPGAPLWFQLYVNEDVAFTRRVVERAETAGYGAIVLTVDLPVLGYREREKRRGWALDVPLGNFTGRDGADAAAEADRDGRVDLDTLLDQRHAGLTWDGLAAIRSWTSLPLVLKGILHPDDARLAVEHGAAAIMVSNHGGRQLDRTPASLDALEAVVRAVDGRAEVYLDGGIRRGSDVLMAVALGARAVFTGRPFVWALAAGGEAGVDRAFAILAEELERAMSLLGTPTLEAVTRDLVVP
jgi:4-hydroxymandelate oxidase